MGIDNLIMAPQNPINYSLARYSPIYKIAHKSVNNFWSFGLNQYVLRTLWSHANQILAPAVEAAGVLWHGGAWKGIKRHKKAPQMEQMSGLLIAVSLTGSLWSGMRAGMPWAVIISGRSLITAFLRHANVATGSGAAPHISHFCCAVQEGALVYCLAEKKENQSRLFFSGGLIERVSPVWVPGAFAPDADLFS